MEPIKLERPMNPKWSFRHSITFKAPLFILSLLSLLSSLTSKASEDFDALLMTENTTVALCGELNYKRQSRDCLDSQNLKQCLDLNHRDPLYVYQEKSSYSCVNSSYSAGVKIIKDQLLESEKLGGCLAGNFRHYYDQVVDSNEFMELSRRFQENLGQPLRLNYGIDVKDGLFNLQMDTTHIEGDHKEMINISIGNFSEKGHCQKLSSKEIMAKITDEYNRLSLKVAREDYDYYGDKPMSARVFDASRFGKESDDGHSLKRVPSSEYAKTIDP